MDISSSPAPDCQLCPRLVEFRQKNQDLFPHFHNAPVPSFGQMNARLLVVGLAPGLKGANATGRPFTGDFAGDVLYQSLLTHGLAHGTYAKHADDGMSLHQCRITNAVRCVPPENKPTPAEASHCRSFLQQELSAMPDLRVILALGSLSHGSLLKTLGLKAKDHPFGHGAWWDISWQGRPLRLLDSYHTSRYNIQTNRLTQEMFDAIIARAISWLN